MTSSWVLYIVEGCIFRPALVCCSLYTSYLIMILLIYFACKILFKIVTFLFSVPPTLHLDPSNQKIVVRSGTTVALRCKASGNPAPKITWRKRNDRLPAGEISDGGTSFSMTEVTWHHTGAYECEADNGVGPTVKAEIKLQILCKFKTRLGSIL